jgi:zinc protease
LHAGDRRWTFPSTQEISAADPGELKATLDPALRSGSIEVDIVGDITVDKAIEEVAETFGALPPRPDPAPPGAPAYATAFPHPAATPIVETHKGRTDQGIAFIAWPTDDYFASPEKARANAMLGRVLQLRLTEVLRLGEGVTYSPSAGAVASTVFPHYGYISAEMEAPPEKLDGFFTDVDKIAADLRGTAIGDDELGRAKKPALDALEKATATNEYWLNGLAGAQADPRRLDMLRSAAAGLERISAADIQMAAQAYLKGYTAWRLEIRPKAAAVASVDPATKAN